jgi:hypothetical protein
VFSRLFLLLMPELAMDRGDALRFKTQIRVCVCTVANAIHPFASLSRLLCRRRGLADPGVEAFLRTPQRIDIDEAAGEC